MKITTVTLMLLASAVTVHCNGVEYWKSQIPDIESYGGIFRETPNFNDNPVSENGGIADNTFVEGTKVACTAHDHCYDFSAPNAWLCEAGLGTTWFWADASCYCDSNIGACVHERMKDSQRYWAYCIPEYDRKC